MFALLYCVRGIEMNISRWGITLLTHTFPSDIPAFFNSPVRMGLACSMVIHQVWWLCLITPYVGVWKETRNEQAGNDLCYHFASHIWICATFIIMAGIDSVLRWHHSEVKCCLLSQANVSGEVPLFSITPPMTLYVALARQCSVKKGVCVCVCLTSPPSTSHCH